jgi:hypothetical protein
MEAEDKIKKEASGDSIETDAAAVAGKYFTVRSLD